MGSSLYELSADRSRELNALTQISAIISQCLDLDEALDQALHVILDVIRVGQGGVWVMEEGGAMRLAASVRQNQAVVHCHVCGEMDSCLCSLAVRAGRTLLVNDLYSSFDLPQPPACQRDVRSLLVVPIQMRDQMMGMIRVADESSQALDAQDEVFLTAAGRQIGVAIENARLRSSERQRRKLADTLLSVSQSLVSSLDLNTVLDSILEQLGTVLCVDAGLILLVDGDMLEVLAVGGRPELNMARWRNYRFPVQSNYHFSQTLAIQQPLTFCDPKRKGLFQQDFDRIEDASWCLVAPMILNHRPLGLIALEQFNHCYDREEEAQIAFAFANQAAIAISNAILYAEAQGLNQKLEERVERRTRQLMDAQNALQQQAQQLRRLLNATIEVQEKERSRIARDVHDGVVQWVLSALFELEAGRLSLHKNPDHLAKRLSTVQSMLQHVKDELHHIIYNLHPALLVSDGLGPALRVYVGEFGRTWGLEIRVVVDGVSRRFAPKDELAFYRIAQEALRNAVDHGRASRVVVHLGFDPTRIRLSIQDNGRGFDVSGSMTAHPHLGLIGMYERAAASEAHLEVVSVLGKGTTVTVTLADNGSTALLAQEVIYVSAHPSADS